MNKKFLSAILFGALMVTSTGTFVSCKDYDDDIDAINSELTDIKSQLAALQAKVDAGKWITSASQTATGVTITLSDGSSLNITNGKDGADGKDGAQGAAGQNGADGKDGKNGTVVTVNENGVLCLDGVETAIKVAEEAPAAKPCVKVENDELYVLNAEGEYVASGIKACGVTAVNTNGVWTITVDGESITVPGSAALTSIAIQGDKDLVYTYAYFTEDKKWGWDKEETMEAGFYSRLKEDVQVLLNPAEADGTAFTYSFRNSVKAVEGINFFGEARPSTAVLTRAASGNGVWTLPAAVTKHDAKSISELRNELYLNFKQNDKEYYAMSLEAIDGMGNVSTRSDYEYKITLTQAGGTPSVAKMYCLVGQEYYPSVSGPVYDYKIRIKPTVANKKYAKAFGIEVTEDEKGFIANNEAAVFNDILFQVAWVTIGGATGTSEFAVSFTNEFTDSEEVRVEGEKKALNAVLAKDPKFTAYVPHPDVVALLDEDLSDDYAFVIQNTYDLSKVYETLSEEAQLILEDVFSAKKTLIGGESSGEENYNELNRNTELAKHITWNYDAKNKAITVNYYVSKNWAGADAYAEDLEDAGIDAEDALTWVEYSNFQLNTAYQLNLAVIDEDSNTEIATFELPFEFGQPEIEEVGVSRNTEGTFSLWTSHNEYWPAIDKNHHCDVLYSFGSYDNENMYVPLYDAFNIWTKVPYVDKNMNPNAKYYTMTADTKLEDIDETIKMSQVSYNGTWQYPTFEPWRNAATNDLDYDFKKAIEAQYDDEALDHEKEVWTYVKTSFDFYGVYPATKAQLGYFGEGNSTTAGFRLVYASTIQKSTIEMTEDVLYANAKTGDVFVSNDNVEATTMLGEDFVLFDGLYGNTTMDRASLNYERGFNEEQRPFVAVAEYEIFAKYVRNDKDIIVDENGEPTFIQPQTGTWAEDIDNGKYVIGTVDPATAAIQVYNMPSMPYIAKGKTVNGVKYDNGMKAQTGGLVIVLGDEIEDRQPVELTIRVKDTMGFFTDLKVIVQKLK